MYEKKNNNNTVIMHLSCIDVCYVLRMPWTLDMSITNPKRTANHKLRTADVGEKNI
jgi:hypothetical protein